MSVDQVDDILIVNKALIKIAEATIDSLENAENKASRTMKILLPQAKNFIFRQHPWNCLRKREVVVLSAEKPLFGYEYKYGLPTDCLRPLAIQTDRGNYVPFYEASYGGDMPNDKQFVIEDRYILTNTEPHTGNGLGQIGLNFVYTRNPENLTNLDPVLIELIAYYLAVEVAYTFTGSVTLKQQLIAEQKECLKAARAINAQEIAPNIPIGKVLGAHW